MLTRLPNRQWNEEQRRLALHRAYSLILSWPATEAMLQVEVMPDISDNQSALTATPNSGATKPLMAAAATERRTAFAGSVGAGASETALQPVLEDDGSGGSLGSRGQV